MERTKEDRLIVRDKLLQADTTALLLALVEETKDRSLLESYGQYISEPFSLQDEFPAEARQVIAELAADRWVTGGFQSESLSSRPDLLADLGEQAAQRDLDENELDLVQKEMGLLGEAFVDWEESRPKHADSYRVIIIGAGLSGIATAVHLKRMGIDFVIYDRLNDIGGTWLTNTYPGCAVDILSHFFSYSFHRNDEWSSYYSPQPEVLQYLKEVVDAHGLREHIHFNTNVSESVFDESAGQWVVEIEETGSNRTERAEFLVSAVGALSSPHIPELPGMDTFEGKIVHSAEWDTGIKLAGKRVALVGNGASANQIGPNIADEVEHLTVITRSPQWISKAPKYGERLPEGEIWALKHIEPYSRWFRIRSMLAMNEAMRRNATLDPEYVKQGKVNAFNEDLKAKLTEYISQELGHRQDLLPHLVPDFPPGMKRMLRDNGWARMFRRDDVKLVPSRATAMDETAIYDQKGNRHEIDVAIFATGFKVARMVGTTSIIGTRGSLRDAWGEDDPRAFLGMTVPGFPNLFIQYGPNTNIGVGGSIFFQAEAQSMHIAQTIRDAITVDARTIEIREDVFREYNEDLDAELNTMIWSLPLGSTWYRNSKGRVVANMPWTSQHYWDMARNTRLEAYEVSGRNLQTKQTNQPQQNEVAHV